MADEVTEQVEQTHSGMNLKRKMLSIQYRLKAPKNQWNSYGSYKYRSCEDILEGLKPLLYEYGVYLHITDSVEYTEGRFYVVATVTAYDVDSDDLMVCKGRAREPENKKGSDQSQVTGSCSSYARKYALNAMFLIDDTKDADADEHGKKPKEPPVGQEFVAHCASCGTAYTFNDRDYYLGFIQNPGCCQSPKWVVD